MISVSREDLISSLSEKSGYYKQDIRALLKSLDDVVFEYLNEVDDGENVEIQLVAGLKIGCKRIGERKRKDPRTQEDIICSVVIKPFARFSDWFRKKIQNNYENKKE